MVNSVTGSGFGAAVPPMQREASASRPDAPEREASSASRAGAPAALPAAPSAKEAPGAESAKETVGTASATQKTAGAGRDRPSKAGGAGELTRADEQVIRQLKSRDQEVRRHEQAHLAAGGQYVRGGASYAYQTGPDGRRYAVGGEVSIDTGTERTPEATIRKAQAIKRAALAPANPSGADRAIAAAAGQMEVQARRELAREVAAEAKENRTVQENEDAEPIEEAGGARDEAAGNGAAANAYQRVAEGTAAEAPRLDVTG